MKKFLLFIFLFLFSFSFGQNLKTNSDYSFTENIGQIIDQDGKENSSVKYLFHLNGLNVQIKNEGFSYDVYEVQKTKKKKSKRKEKDFLTKNKSTPDYDLKYQFHRVDIDFVDANKAPQIVAEGKSEDYDNYYNIPNKPNGVEKVHRYQKITYKNLYPKVDLVFFKPNDTLKPVEYNFIVNPGGKISDIQLKFKGAKTKLRDGKLSMDLRFGEMQENIPHSWEEEGNFKKSINVGFKDLGNGVFGFNADRDISDKIVVIDPVPTRIWGSYFGGNGEEFVWLKPDKNNNIYLAGYSSSTNNIATTGSYQSSLIGNADAVISKISKDGKRFWGTYYGKLYFDSTGSVDFDENFNIYAAIFSQKPNPAYPNNYYYYHPKIILVKLDSNGALLLQNEVGSETGNPFYGGYSDEIEINDVKFLNNKIYVTGETRVAGFGTPGSFQENIGTGYSGFFAKFDTQTANLDHFTYIGNTGFTNLFSIFNADSSGIEIIGGTTIKNFPMIDAFQAVHNGNPSIGGNNGLYLKFSETGNLIKSSYLGGPEYYYFMSAERFGSEVMFGARMGTKNKICYYLVDTVSNIIKDYKEATTLNNDGHIYIDRQRNIFTAGRASPNDPWVNNVTTPNAYIPKIGNYISIFFTKYDVNLQKIWSTFYQGNGGTQLGMIMKDYDNFLYFYGMSSNNKTGIATPGTFQQTGGHPTNDVFIAKFADCASNVNVSFTPTCINQNLQLNASGGTAYEWYGPNGFTSNLQNPIIVNAQASNSGEYFVRITGGQSCGGIFSLIVNIGSPTLPILDVPNLPNITALCSVTITTIPTATTGCGTKIFATTTNPLNYNTPGTYVIVWNYNDGLGNTLTQNQNVIVQSIALPTATANQNFCLINSPKISDLQITGTDIKWYSSSGVPLSINTLLGNGKYFATQTLNGCESAKTEITVTINDPNPPTGNNLQDFCSAQLPKISDLVATGQNIRWYDQLGTLIHASTLLSDGKTYYGTQTVNGCESTQKMAITVTINNGGIPASDYATAFCNDTTANTKNINLNDYKINLVANPADYSFDFFYANNQMVTNPASENLSIGENIFNVKVYNSLGCEIYVKLSLTLNPKPILNLPQTDEFCNGQSVDLDAGSGFSSYEWTKDDDPTIIFNQQIFPVSVAGKYTVKVKNTFLCENSASIIVTESVIATITGVQIVNSTATVLLSNSGDFEYSLDNLAWQDSNIFPNLPNGNYTVFVRTKLGCIIGSANFSIFSVPNAFTPDADGINDTWKIDGLEYYPNSEVQVYDRFGNMVLQKIINGTFEWNGTFNSRKLPTGNYWYVVKVSDGRLLNGWVLLKNRN